MDLDDFLKKAMEEEMRSGEPDDEETRQQKMAGRAVGSMMNILSLGKMVNLSKAAMKKKTQLIEELTAYLAEQDKTDKASWNAHCSAAILSAAKKINILDVLISSTVLGGIADNEEDYKSIIDSILTVNMIH